VLGTAYCCSLAVVVPRKTETELSEYECLSDSNIVSRVNFLSESELKQCSEMLFLYLYGVYVNLLE
jgi:hypothetical protein